jgi:hypothetical protein
MDFASPVRGEMTSPLHWANLPGTIVRGGLW